MMMSEFIERVGFEPTAAEYQQIEAEYMGTNIDKDAFCKEWKKNGGVQRLCRMRARRIEELEHDLKMKDKQYEECEQFWEKKVNLLSEQSSRRENELKDKLNITERTLNALNIQLSNVIAEKAEVQKNLETVREAFKILGIAQ